MFTSDWPELRDMPFDEVILVDIELPDTTFARDMSKRFAKLKHERIKELLLGLIKKHQ
jgi:hypothetical protein